jgi:phosphate transport system substrate-binding protein
MGVRAAIMLAHGYRSAVSLIDCVYSRLRIINHNAEVTKDLDVYRILTQLTHPMENYMRPTSSFFVRNARIVCLLALTLVLTPASAGAADLQIVGTGDGIDLLRALGNDFMQRTKSVQVEIPPSIGSGGGIAAIGADKAVLGRVARKLTGAEIASGIVYKPIARLPSAFFVHPGVGVTALTSDQLRNIYSGRVTDWSELGGANLRIRVVRREDSDSTLTVLRQMMPGWKDLEITEKSKTATTTQDAIDTVRDVAGAIGFGPYSATLEPEVSVLRINSHHPLDPAYPSNVELALIYKNATVTPAAREFVDYAHSAKARAVISQLGSVPVQ